MGTEIPMERVIEPGDSRVMLQKKEVWLKEVWLPELLWDSLSFHLIDLEDTVTGETFAPGPRNVELMSFRQVVSVIRLQEVSRRNLYLFPVYLSPRKHCLTSGQIMRDGRKAQATGCLAFRSLKE
jgi:hypothetical protein